jgi:hypothetical protein
MNWGRRAIQKDRLPHHMLITTYNVRYRGRQEPVKAQLTSGGYTFRVLEMASPCLPDENLERPIYLCLRFTYMAWEAILHPYEYPHSFQTHEHDFWKQNKVVPKTDTVHAQMHKIHVN